MKILQLTAENVKKLKVVDITPNTDVVQITGKNGSGKTSVLDSIWWALGGTKEIQAMPIRKGQESARIKLDLGEIIVTRKFNDKGSTLTVENAEGARFSSPQKMLDDLIGELSFDPLAFAKMEGASQYKELKRIAKIEVDLDALDAQNKLDYDTRTLRNREEKEYRTRAEGFEFKFEAMEKPIDVNALITELSNAAQHNADIDARAQRREDTATKIQSTHAEIVLLEAKAASLKKQVAEWQEKLDIAEPLPDKIVVDDLRGKISDAQARNAEFALRAERAKLLEQVKTAEAASDALTKKMEERTKAKEEAIAAAKMPIEGACLCPVVGCCSTAFPSISPPAPSSSVPASPSPWPPTRSSKSSASRTDRCSTRTVWQLSRAWPRGTAIRCGSSVSILRARSASSWKTARLSVRPKRHRGRT